MSRLSTCNAIKIIALGQECAYCRFFRDGVYLDRIFVAEPALLASLLRVSGSGRETGASGVARRRNLLQGLGSGRTLHRPL
jgi:hypothetical protein